MQESYLRLYNIDFQIHGALLTSYDPINLVAENINFDFDYATWGFVIETDCNYPSAVNTGEVTLRNNWVYSGSLIKKVRMLNGYISFTSSKNLTISDCEFLTETPLADNWSVVRIKGMPTCNP